MIDRSKVVLLLFYTDEVQEQTKCKHLAKSFASSFPEYSVFALDINKNERLCYLLNIEHAPTYVLYKDGELMMTWKERQLEAEIFEFVRILTKQYNKSLKT